MTDLFTFNAVCLPIFASLLHPQQIREEPSALDADFRAGSGAPAVMDSNAKKPTTLTPARLIDFASSMNGLLFIFILRRPLLLLLSRYQCEPQRSLQQD
jgi:hypothetical protein